MSAVIEARGVTAGYNGVPAIRDVSLVVESGEIVLLLGPNGAGKTTTCMTLAGVIRPMSGAIIVNGTATKAALHTRVREGMGLLPERRAVFNSLTVMENLRLGRGKPQKVLELFPELEKRLNVKAGLLSGGEQQMLSLGRVLAAEPDTVFVDELSFGLAPIIVRRLLRALREQADAGSGVLLIEQHVNTALEYADRAYFLKRGQVAFHERSEWIINNEAKVAALYL
jgi:branched-chain amino acid transport system ATP-binding protein